MQLSMHSATSCCLPILNTSARSRRSCIQSEITKHHNRIRNLRSLPRRQRRSLLR
jgi:hypothetical protein